MAIEKGQLQNLIFDNEALTSHRAMGAILSSILKLEPAKRALANGVESAQMLIAVTESENAKTENQALLDQLEAERQLLQMNVDKERNNIEELKKSAEDMRTRAEEKRKSQKEKELAEMVEKVNTEA